MYGKVSKKENQEAVDLLRSAIADIRDESSDTLERKVQALPLSTIRMLIEGALNLRNYLVDKPWRE